MILFFRLNRVEGCCHGNYYLNIFIFIFRSLSETEVDVPEITNRDILELLFTFRNEDKSSAVPSLHSYLVSFNFISEARNIKCFWRKLNDIEKHFSKLKKNHNARCEREGSHQTEKLNAFMAKPFYQTIAPKKLDSVEEISFAVVGIKSVSCDLESTATAVDCDYNSKATDETRNTLVESAILSTPIDCCPTTPSENKEYVTVKTVSNAGVQVSSPQIRTEGQIRRIERKAKRQLIFSNNVIEELKEKVEMKDELRRQSDQKKRNALHKLKDKRDKMAELNNRCKQMSADLKKATALETEKKKSERALHKTKSVITELIDENNDLEKSVKQLSNTLSTQKHKTRTLQKKVSKLKTKKEKAEESIKQLCTKIESGQDVERCIGQICDEVCAFGGKKTLIKSLATAMRTALPVKDNSGYSDHVTLLMIELQNLGVPQASVGKVANACTKHLCGRELTHVVSRRTAGRMVRRGGILSDIQVAVELTENASHGFRIGQDTTTRRGNRTRVYCVGYSQE